MKANNYSRIILAISVLLLLIAVAQVYYLFVKNQHLKITLLEEICSNVSSTESRSDVNARFNDIYSIKQIDPEINQYRYGISNSDFDPFCIITYSDDNMVITSGFSFD